jgi:hypothetical protein
MDGKTLTELLAARLDKIVPHGFHVRNEDGVLMLSVDDGVGYFGGRSGSHVADNLDLNAGEASLEERAALASECALSDMQDYISEQTTEPWPGRADQHAHAAVRSGRLYLWFGERDVDRFDIEPIELPAQ